MNDEETLSKYNTIANKATIVYNNTLWNGHYFNYDSSHSNHHDSIMADMMHGQFYSRVCNLPPITSITRAISSYQEIYLCNVLQFGNGKLKGAVNGMKPPKRNALGEVVLHAQIDNCCIQSREVWTGTTYLLAAGMILEANAVFNQSNMTANTALNPTVSNDSSSEFKSQEGHEPPIMTSTIMMTSETLSPSIASHSHIQSPTSVATEEEEEDTVPCHITIHNNTKNNYDIQLPGNETIVIKSSMEKGEELKRMAMNTLQGIHNGGWEEYGYWFATPEGWEANGNYRSLGYMRPLAIWAVQFAIETKEK